MRLASPRWAISFADLTLLLLGFFVLLHARAGDGERIADSVKTALHGTPGRPLHAADESASALFEPGEAVLRPAARARFLAAGRSAMRVTIASRGYDAGGRRLDRWELAAARAAAVARAYAEAGVDPQNIIVSVADAIADDAREQRIRISVASSKSSH